jgi:hypothetical protein
VELLYKMKIYCVKTGVQVECRFRTCQGEAVGHPPWQLLGSVSHLVPPSLEQF